MSRLLFSTATARGASLLSREFSSALRTPVGTLRPLVASSLNVGLRTLTPHHGGISPFHFSVSKQPKVLLSTSTNAEVLGKVVNQLEGLKEQQNKFFAVVQISGRQFKITPNDLIVVNQIPADVGDEIYLEKVLLAGSEDVTLIGTPLLSAELIRIKATVTEHTKTAKVIVFKKKRRKNYKRKHGHRQPVSVLRINSININAQSQLN